MRVVLDDELLEEQHVALEFVRNRMLAHLDFAYLHVGRETCSALVALHLVDFEHDFDVFFEQDIVEDFLLDVQPDSQFLGGDILLDPSCFQYFEEFELGYFTETKLKQFFTFEFTFEPLVVVVEVAVTLFTEMDGSF